MATVGSVLICCDKNFSAKHVNALMSAPAFRIPQAQHCLSVTKNAQHKRLYTHVLHAPRRLHAGGGIERAPLRALAFARGAVGTVPIYCSEYYMYPMGCFKINLT